MHKSVDKLLLKLVSKLDPEFKKFMDSGIIDNFKTRVLRRFKQRAYDSFGVPRLRSYEFEELFSLPKWIPLWLWLYLQLRGRPVDYYFKDLSVDHIVALDRAQTFEELVRLSAWDNIRLIPPDINSLKGSYWDSENKYLCEIFLGREHNGSDRFDPYIDQKQIEAGDILPKPIKPKTYQKQRKQQTKTDVKEVTQTPTDRFEKLLSRAQGKSIRASISSKNRGQKKGKRK